MIDLSPAANPDWAADALTRIDVHALPATAEGRRRLAVVLGTSMGLGDLLAGHPEMLATFDLGEEERKGEGEGRGKGDGDGDGEGAEDPEELSAWEPQDVIDRALSRPRDDGWLALLQREGVLRIAIRDLMGQAATDVAALELSHLADGILGAALAVVGESDHAADAELCVLGMGKLGGQELNYVSDVDVLFVHRGDTEAAERMARAFLQLTGGHTRHGMPYEMDANLRPEGRNGPLTRSLDSYAAYYERWAKTWEFQSLLKVRPVAGPADLAAAYEALVQPHVWPEALGADAVQEIQTMKGRVERSRPVVRDGMRQIKLAPGGLRDIEFAVQMLQLVHGPGDPELRARGTLPALAALAAGGYVDDGDANLFGDAYLFLRTVEHRLQLRNLRRTHTLPEGEEDVQRLARAMGFRDLPTRTAGAEFERELTRVRGGVRRLHQQMFYRPLLSTIASWGTEERLDRGARMDAGALKARLRALSFEGPAQALTHLEALVRGTDRTARQLRVVLPAMLETLADTPDPDAGLAALRQLTDEVRANPRFLRTVRDNPSSARLLAEVLGRSPRLWEWFTRQPEVLRLLDEAEALARPRSREELHAGAAGLVRRGHGGTGGDALRRYKRREALRTALRDVTAKADVVQVGAELTWLSEGLLQAAVTTVVGEEDVRLAVIALGRFGAGELAHSSDLDVLFVHDGDTVVAERAAADVVELLGSVTPEGAAFRIDTGLRPEGRSGPLSRSLDSHRAYYERWADPWEMLAMTQARPVAGDADLGQAFIDVVHPLVYTDPVDRERLVAVRRMKARLETERGGAKPTRLTASRPPPRLGARPRNAVRSTTGQRRSLPDHAARDDIKLGPGGLSDVEWTVQLLALAHGGAEPVVRGPGTLAVMEALRQIGVLSEEETAWLRSGWLLLSTVRNTLYLIGERDTSSIPTDARRQAKLAVAMHEASAQGLVEDVDRARRRIRKVFDRRFFAQ